MLLLLNPTVVVSTEVKRGHISEKLSMPLLVNGDKNLEIIDYFVSLVDSFNLLKEHVNDVYGKVIN